MKSMVVKGILISLCERFFPIILTMVSFIVCFNKGFNLSNLKDYKSLFTNTISFASIFIGVIITMATLFLGYSSKMIVKKIKEQNADNILSTYFAKPIFWGLFLVVGSIVLANTLDEKVLKDVLVLKIISSLWIAISVFFISSIIRILWIMLHILKAVFEEDTTVKVIQKDNTEVVVNFDKDVF